jgi:hypothetical protein
MSEFNWSSINSIQQSLNNVIESTKLVRKNVGLRPTVSVLTDEQFELLKNDQILLKAGANDDTKLIAFYGIRLVVVPPEEYAQTIFKYQSTHDVITWRLPDEEKG